MKCLRVNTVGELKLAPQGAASRVGKDGKGKLFEASM